MKEAGQDEDFDPSQTLDDANLMVEGVILSDSELMVDEDFDDLQEWEQGEITDPMEEEEVVDHDTAVEVNGEAVQDNMDDASEKIPKNKATKPGTVALGGSTKKRNVQNLVSPRKKLLAKAASKAGGKGAAASKKAITKA
ncbi:hypothetical protein DY000_02040019 [Brassica cretica]|uniref:Uncharacterized protein n=1 Tax=Brassica cretica TaxID=69181 RepID=A0ABQ7B5N3_BRACR|nr:hypothetical protein DY000_02040019 [Brassica cretica]